MLLFLQMYDLKVKCCNSVRAVYLKIIIEILDSDSVYQSNYAVSLTV